MRVRSLALALAVTEPGCASAGAYWKSRALDLWDIMPMAVQLDVGMAVSARVTPFAQTGFGFYGIDADSANSWGMGLGRWGRAWKEQAVHVLIGSIEYQEIEDMMWPGGPDRPYRRTDEGRFARRSGNFLVVLPLAGLHDPPVWVWADFPPWYGLLDCELELFLGLGGVRLGLAPLQLPDFLLGFLGIDFVGDDIPAEEVPPGPPLDNHDEGQPADGRPLTPPATSSHR